MIALGAASVVIVITCLFAVGMSLVIQLIESLFDKGE